MNSIKAVLRKSYGEMESCIKSIPLLNKFETRGNARNISPNTYTSINLAVIKMNVTMWLIY